MHSDGDSTEKASITLPGTVEKIIKPPHPSLPEKAQIAIDEADHLYREIRIENALTDQNGEPVRLKEGASVEVTVEADPKDTDQPEAEAERPKRATYAWPFAGRPDISNSIGGEGEPANRCRGINQPAATKASARVEHRCACDPHTDSAGIRARSELRTTVPDDAAATTFCTSEESEYAGCMATGMDDRTSKDLSTTTPNSSPTL